MARYGFTGTMDDTKLYIVYILSNAQGAVTRMELQEIALIDENADYFIYTTALAELLETGMFQVFPGGDVMALPRAREHSTVIESALPFSLRKQALELLGPVNARIRRDRLIQAKYDDTLNTVTLLWHDEHTPLIQLTLAVGNEEQGRIVMQHWKERAESVYQVLLKELL